jgi:hypothetical protein
VRTPASVNAETMRVAVRVDAPVTGDLLAKLVSADNSGRDGDFVAVFGKDEMEMNNGGNHPWSIENGNDSTILLFNHSSKPEPFYLLVSYNAVQWKKTYTLAPMQTETVSIRQLISDEMKDDDGHVLPRNAQSGQADWWNQDIGLGKGRLLLSNRTTGMARNFSCSILRGLCGISTHLRSSHLQMEIPYCSQPQWP